VNAGNNVTICDHDSTHLNAIAQTSNGVTYNWAPSTGLNCTNCQNPWASPTVTTTYSVVATNGICTYTDSVTVNVSSVLAAFTATPPSGAVPLNVVFTNNSVNGTSYQWNFGDGSPIDNSMNPTHNYANNGTYIVTLITINANGCADTTTFTIVVEQPYSIVIPNVFSPNGDGFNDEFIPKFSGVTELSCDIYNRWGELIYSWNTLSGSWNGSTKGGPAPDGTYYYVMTLHAADGTLHTEKGFVELLRNK
jgi:gliding motility-associated-like protein